MQIIIEGPDKVGKTTLGVRVAEELDIGFYRRSTRIDVFSHAMWTFKELECCVIDRSWPSELAYSKALNRSPSLNLSQLYEIGLFAQKSVVLVFMLIPDRGKLITTVDRAYLDNLSHWSLPSDRVMYDPSPDYPTDHVVRNIVAFYTNWTSAMRSLEFLTNPHVVGQICPNKCDVLVDAALYSPNLLSLLYHAGLSPQQVAITAVDIENANEVLRPKILFKPPAVIDYKSWPRALKSLTEEMAAAKVEPRIGESGLNLMDIEREVADAG